MPFTVETGSGIADANSFCTVSFVDDFATLRGHTAWTGSTAVKQAALVRASEYVDKRFASAFIGVRETQAQGLSWPRHSAKTPEGFYYEGVPVDLQKAVAEYAIRALLLGTLAPDPLSTIPAQSLTTGAGTRTPAGAGTVTSVKTVIGPIEKETKFADPTPQYRDGSGVVQGGNLPAYPEADMWLTKLINNPATLKISRG
jgi:hypothetical protein